MEFETVLVERENSSRNEIVSSSGLLFDNKFVLVTCNLLSDLMEELYENFYGDSTVGRKIYFGPFKHDKVSLNIVTTDDQGLYVFRTANILCAFASENIKRSNKYIFRNWAVDAHDNNTEILETLGLFFILTLDIKYDSNVLKSSLEKWWNSIKHVDLQKCDSIYIESVPFGNRHFLNSYSTGIVSNIFGNNSCLILSDCSSTAGSESSPVYVVK